MALLVGLFRPSLLSRPSGLVPSGGNSVAPADAGGPAGVTAPGSCVPLGVVTLGSRPLGVGGVDRRRGGGGEQSWWFPGVGGAAGGGVCPSDAVVEAPSRVPTRRCGGYFGGLGCRRMVGRRGDDSPVPIGGFG